MLRLVKQALSSIAVASLLVAQPAFATRSADSLPAPGAKLGAVHNQRVGSPVGKAERMGGGSYLAVAGLIGLLVLILATNSGNKSPG
ncbi:MAG: hypothetical protein ACXWJC_11990 [Croceibacterium sp.]